VDLIWGTASAFSWRKWKPQEKTQPRYPSFRKYEILEYSAMTVSFGIPQSITQ